MNAYLFGRHSGELPAHLLTADSGIFAMARLQNSAHDVYYAAAVPESASVGDVVGTVQQAGSDITQLIIGCVSDWCIGLVEGIAGPCKIPGRPAWFVFLIIEGTERLDHLRHARERLGDDNVAAVYNGDGQFLVELAADDRELLEELVSSFSALDSHRVASSHWVAGEQLLRV